MKIISVDLGDARTGIAVCDESEFLASPFCVLNEKNPDRLVEKVAEAAGQAGAKMIVVGLPKNMDGTEGARAEKSRTFAKTLAERSGLPVELWDERLTTTAAHDILNVLNVRGKARKNTVDKVAAVLILEGFLRRRRG